MDIDIRFVTGYHGCEKPFDGPGHVLAHAAMPYVHFDDSENWSRGSHYGVKSFYAVAVHEIGHSLGLSHSDDKNAIMYGTYNSGSVIMNLNSDDIQVSLQSLDYIGNKLSEFHFVGHPKNLWPKNNFDEPWLWLS